MNHQFLLIKSSCLLVISLSVVGKVDQSLTARVWLVRFPCAPVKALICAGCVSLFLLDLLDYQLPIAHVLKIYIAMSQNLGTLGTLSHSCLMDVSSTKIDGILKALSHPIGILGIFDLRALLGSQACTQRGQIDGFILHEFQELLKKSRGRLIGKRGDSYGVRKPISCHQRNFKKNN